MKKILVTMTVLGMLVVLTAAFPDMSFAQDQGKGGRRFQAQTSQRVRDCEGQPGGGERRGEGRGRRLAERGGQRNEHEGECVGRDRAKHHGQGRIQGRGRRDKQERECGPGGRGQRHARRRVHRESRQGRDCARGSAAVGHATRRGGHQRSARQCPGECKG
jgi:hypothetical protein